MSKAMQDHTRVLYNDDCPVCRFEIRAYRKRTEADALPIRYDTLTQAAEWGLTPDQGARRLHVMHGGKVLSGLPAFRALWSEMPHMAWLARLTGWLVVAPVSAFVYDRVLAPVLYRAHLRRSRKRA